MFGIEGREWDFRGCTLIMTIAVTTLAWTWSHFASGTSFITKNASIHSVRSSHCVLVCKELLGFYRRETMCVFYVEHVQYVIVFPVPATRSGSGQRLRFFWLLMFGSGSYDTDHVALQHSRLPTRFLTHCYNNVADCCYASSIYSLKDRKIQKVAI